MILAGTAAWGAIFFGESQQRFRRSPLGIETQPVGTQPHDSTANVPGGAISSGPGAMLRERYIYFTARVKRCRDVSPVGSGVILKKISLALLWWLAIASITVICTSESIVDSTREIPFPCAVLKPMHLAENIFVLPLSIEAHIGSSIQKIICLILSKRRHLPFPVILLTSKGTKSLGCIIPILSIV